MALIAMFAKLLVRSRLRALGLSGTRGLLNGYRASHTAFVECRKWNERPSLGNFSLLQLRTSHRIDPRTRTDHIRLGGDGLFGARSPRLTSRSQLSQRSSRSQIALYPLQRHPFGFGNEAKTEPNAD
jgi:hypothetical protein